MNNAEQKSTKLFKSKSTVNPNLRSKRQARSNRQHSIGALEDLLQCGICLEQLNDPKMLPCQHTFCLSCLQSHLNASRILKQHSPDIVAVSEKTAIKCPMCQKKIDLENGSESLNNLPKNLYIDSFLKMVEDNFIPDSGKVRLDMRCAKCHTVALEEEQCCEHCFQVFCNVCWNEHLSELDSNLSILCKQMDESKHKLDHKLENFQRRCAHLKDNIKETTLKKMDQLKQNEKRVLGDIDIEVQRSNSDYNTLLRKVQELKNTINTKPSENRSVKVLSFINLHRETSRILSEIASFGETQIIFDPESFTIDETEKTIHNEIEDHESSSIEIAHQQYKNRSFVPKLVWNRCPRPASVRIPPWAPHLLFIAATHTHEVLVFDRNRKKLQDRLRYLEMVCPQDIAFSEEHQEVYISDKWKHCIHVFSKNGEHLREMLSKGIGPTKVRSPHGLAITDKGQLVIADSGNDRILIVDSQTGEHVSTIGLIDKRTTLNMPTGIALQNDKIVVADTGNHRIKIFTQNGQQIHEFGSLGTGRGQFQGAEVVAVDPLGFIVVGDSGNARLQVFEGDGTVVKVFGGSRDFGWISGVCVTNEYDIVVSDSKNRCLKIF